MGGAVGAGSRLPPDVDAAGVRQGRGMTVTPAASCARAADRPTSRAPRLALLALASVVAVGLLTARVALTGRLQFGFLLWNLFLAWVPYWLSLAMMAAHRAGRSGTVLLAWGVPWLAFLPNAPYLVTDLVHLRARAGVPLGYDATMLVTFALAGLMLGMVSLRLVHHVAAARAGALWGWVTAVAVLALSAVGIVLGRVYRFNSWDLLLDARGLLQVVARWLRAPLHDPATLAVLGLGAGGLLLAYAATWAVVPGGPGNHGQAGRPTQSLPATDSSTSFTLIRSTSGSPSA